MVCVVHAIELGSHRGRVLALQILKGEERAGTVGEEGVARIGIVTGAHKGQNGNVVNGELFLVKADTVRRKTNVEAILRDGILQCHLKQRGVLVLADILGLQVVGLHILEGIVGASGTDGLLDTLQLGSRDRGVENVDVHRLRDRVLVKHILLQVIRNTLVQRLEHIVDHDLTEVEGGRLKRMAGFISELLRLFIGHTVVILKRGTDQRLKAGLLNTAGDQTLRVLTTDRVLHADTVLNVFNLDLILECGVLVARVLLLTAVLGKLYDDLRENLVLSSFI